MHEEPPIFRPEKSLRDVARKLADLSAETLDESYHRLYVPDGLIGRTDGEKHICAVI